MSMDYSGTPGEYIYSHNATGKSASGIIANGSTSERDLGAQRSAGGADRQAGDQGGHLIADRFGGRNDPTNLDAQAANVNQKDQANVERNVANLAANPNNTVSMNVSNFNSAFYQFALIACVYIIMVICCMMGLFRFSFASYFITSKISGLIRFVMEAAKTIVLQVSRLVISALGRRSEFMADRFAADMGYAFYLRRFLERFAPDTGASGQTFLSVLYDTHPSLALRIQQLNSIDKQRMLPWA